MPIGDELVFEIIRWRECHKPTNQVIFLKTPVQDLLFELRTFLISIRDHVPRDSETLGERRIDARIPTLLEVNDTNSMRIE
jgi:hypothetical protein